MIKIEKTEVFGWEAAIRGMRNPMNSWDKSDSIKCYANVDCPGICENNMSRICIGENDFQLMKKLSAAGNDHSKYLRMINVTCDITAPKFWWSEADTYKVGTVRNSCSKMHKIHVQPFKCDDFSHEGVDDVAVDYPSVFAIFKDYVDLMEWLREQFNETQEKRFWRALIEMLPEGYNMKATLQLNYQVLKSMYNARKNHKLDEWRQFREWIETLPYAKGLIYNDTKKE